MKYRKLLAAGAVYVSAAIFMTQQIPAAVNQRQPVQQEKLKQRYQRKTDVTLADDAEEISDYVKEKQDVILAAPDTAEASQITYNSVTLVWSEVEGAAGYQIEYSSDGTNYTVAGHTKAGTETFKCKGLLTGAEYQIRVCALDADEKVGNYAIVKAQPYLKKTKFTAVTSPKLQSVLLEWKKVAGATGYQLYRSSGEENKFKVIAVTAKPAYEDKTATAGETYSYRVRAVREVEGKTVKAKLSAAVQASLNMPQVQIESCEEVDFRSANLTWAQAEGVSGYYIYRSVKEDGSYHKIKTIADNSTLSYTDKKIVPGKKFYYKICPYVQAADKTVTAGELSEAVSVQTQMNAPQLVSVKTNVENRSLALEWEKAEGATGYRIYRSSFPDKGFQKITDIANGSYVGYEDRAVTPGATYYYKLKAIYANSSYKGLSAAGAVLEGNAAASAPIGLTVLQSGTDMLQISWQVSSGADSYNLYRADTEDTEYTCIAQGLAANTYEDFGLLDNETYTYRVSAVSAAGEGTKCLPVSYKVGGVSMNTRTLKVCVGVSRQLQITTFRQGQAVWKSENPEIAEVNSEGVVTGISYGAVNVTATVAGQSATAVVSVTPGSKNGIDVSRWQEDVDWCRVKNSGVEFAFLRICNHYLEDYTFETKYINASSAGIPLGVYCYSRAANAEEAAEEARTVLNILNGRELQYPVALDMEDAVHKSKTMTKEKLHEMIHTFRQVIEDAGYEFVLYSYVTFVNSNLDRTKLDGIDLWLARYRNISLGTGYTGTGNQKYWQYNSGQYSGSNAQVDGITNEAGELVSVDVNIEY